MSCSVWTASKPYSEIIARKEDQQLMIVPILTLSKVYWY